MDNKYTVLMRLNFKPSVEEMFLPNNLSSRINIKYAIVRKFRLNLTIYI